METEEGSDTSRVLMYLLYRAAEVGGYAIFGLGPMADLYGFVFPEDSPTLKFAAMAVHHILSGALVCMSKLKVSANGQSYFVMEYKRLMVELSVVLFTLLVYSYCGAHTGSIAFPETVSAGFCHNSTLDKDIRR
ncbi:hypothetical protein SAY87_011128 [Trapa incisa]|uniref:Uncharacterized protein n=1 Tax=Trapa incisa TaxID=236973 RepID=A0AAN7JBA1_9MYRT|nr:hypothetical protein SAY87_011128 [Trapa incisa]